MCDAEDPVLHETATKAGRNWTQTDGMVPMTADQSGVSLAFYQDIFDTGENSKMAVDIYSTPGNRAVLNIYGGKVVDDGNGVTLFEGLTTGVWYRLDVRFTKADEAEDFGNLYSVAVSDTQGTVDTADDVEVFRDDAVRTKNDAVMPDMSAINIVCGLGIPTRPRPTTFIDDIELFGREERMAGDVNHDGWVDDDDLSILLANWGGESGEWTLGELSGTIPVDDDDLSLLLANWTGPEPSGAAVPEPCTILLLGSGAALLVGRIRRR